MGIFDFLFGKNNNENNDGTSAERAIIAKDVAAEYSWVRHNCPGFKLEVQALQHLDGKPYDVLTLINEQGDKRTVYFDISSFFGKF